MSNTTKKIIAREGLIIMGFAAAYFIGLLMTILGRLNYTASGIGALIVLASIGGYILYQTLNFFAWAIQTLREKND